MKRFVGKVSLAHHPLNRQGYDTQGRYFGVGEPLYRAIDEDCSVEYVRAQSRASAAQKLGLDSKDLVKPLVGA